MTALCRYDKARDVLRQSLAIRDTPRAQWLLGDALCELGELAQAEPHYHAVQTDAASIAERTHALQQLLFIHRRRGEDHKAAECSKQLVALQKQMHV